MKLITTTTYIGKDGEIVDIKQREEKMLLSFILPKQRQTATIKEWDNGFKIVVSKMTSE